MARSPLFLFSVVTLVAVMFVMVAAQVVERTPTGGNYSVEGTPENLTTGLVVGGIQQAPNYILPVVLVVSAIVVISVLFLIGRRR